MSEIDMPPQYAGEVNPNDTEATIAAAVGSKVENRVDGWKSFVQDAVIDFGGHANLKIEQLEYEYDATYDFNPVVASYASALVDYFPETRMAKSIVSTALSPIEDLYAKELDSSLTGAKLRLTASVVALKSVALQSSEEAVSNIKDQLSAIVDDAMTWVDSASTDPDYVSALCDWMGFPNPTRANTYNLVRQSLENPFFGVYQAVRTQLRRTQGVPGFTDDDDYLNPTVQERAAIESQRQLYNEASNDQDEDRRAAAQEAVWEKAYEHD
jgi:hypothetical protein